MDGGDHSSLPREVRRDFTQQVSFAPEMVAWEEWLMRVRLGSSEDHGTFQVGKQRRRTCGTVGWGHSRHCGPCKMDWGGREGDSNIRSSLDQQVMGATNVSKHGSDLVRATVGETTRAGLQEVSFW